MIKLVSALPAFYMAGDAFPFTINVSFDLDRPIDREALQSSLDRAQTRYPYFSVSVTVTDGQYALTTNPRPLRIFDRADDAVLGSAEANGHLIALAAHDCSIDFLAFHGITDGHGFFPFIKTVLYLYLSAVTGEALDAGSVRLPGEVPFAPEFVDPYPAAIPDSIEPFGRFVPDHPFLLPESVTDSGAVSAYKIAFPENSFMKYTRQSDGSPATMISAFVFKAIQGLHPENDREITCGMAFDRREILHVPETCWNVSDVLHLGYKPAMATLPMTTLATVSRGMVFLQSQPENALVAIRSTMAMIQQLLGLDHEQRRALLSTDVKRRINTDTFNVSYVGRTDFGDLERFIRDMHIYTNIAGTGILVEFTALRGHFDLTFLQDFTDDRYARRLCELLDDEGIEATFAGPVPAVVPGIRLEPNA